MKIFAFFSTFYLLPSIIFGQNIRGKIIDKSTNTPVSYVAITNLQNQLGTYADSLGKFSFNTKIKGQFLFSRVGYESVFIVLNSEVKDTTIFMLPTSTLLDEIKITTSKKKFKKYTLGYFQKIRGPYTADYSPNTGSRLVTYISNGDSISNGIIKTLRYRFSPSKSKIASSFRLRLRLLEDKNGKPSKELLNKDIIVDVASDDRYLEYDVESENITLPSKGVWIGLDVIGYTDINHKFNLINTFQYGISSKYPIAPWIAMDNGTGISFESSWGGKWHKPLLDSFRTFMFGIEYLIEK